MQILIAVLLTLNLIALVAILKNARNHARDVDSRLVVLIGAVNFLGSQISNQTNALHVTSSEHSSNIRDAVRGVKSAVDNVNATLHMIRDHGIAQF